MEISFTDLKEKEIVNVFDGKKLGRIVDILFDNTSGVVRGIVVPGEKKLFRKNEDIFVPLERIRKIGDDVILVTLHSQLTSSISTMGQVGNSYGARKANYAVYKNGQGYVDDMEVDFGYAYPENIKMQNDKSGVIQNQARQKAKLVYGSNNAMVQNCKIKPYGSESFVRYKRIDNKKYK